MHQVVMQVVKYQQDHKNPGDASGSEISARL
jgi:hypothetical protein